MGATSNPEIGTKRPCLCSKTTVTRQLVSFPRQQYRAARKAYVHRNRVLFAFTVAFGLGACLVFSLLLSGYLWAWRRDSSFLCWRRGSCARSMRPPALSGSMAGAWGEDSTTDELRKAKRRGLIWGFVNGVATSTGDVDHVVVTKRGGVVAVYSKYHAHLSSDQVQRDLVSAATSARRARLIMLSFGRRLNIEPVALVWGGAQHLLGPNHKCSRQRRWWP